MGLSFKPNLILSLRVFLNICRLLVKLLQPYDLALFVELHLGLGLAFRLKPMPNSILTTEPIPECIPTALKLK